MCSWYRLAGGSSVGRSTKFATAGREVVLGWFHSWDWEVVFGWIYPLNGEGFLGWYNAWARKVLLGW